MSRPLTQICVGVLTLLALQRSDPSPRVMLRTFACSKAIPAHLPPGRTIEGALSPDKHLGNVDASTLTPDQKVSEPAANPAATRSDGPRSAAECLNLDDFERAAGTRLKAKAWGE